MIRRMRSACWIPQTTDTHSEYVILIVFHSNSGCGSALQYYLYTVRTLPRLSILGVGSVLWYCGLQGVCCSNLWYLANRCGENGGMILERIKLKTLLTLWVRSYNKTYRTLKSGLNKMSKNVEAVSILGAKELT